MKIALLSATSSSYMSMAALVDPNKISYCKKHGYAYINVSTGFPDKHLDKMQVRVPNWEKLILIRNLLPEYDYIMWTDCDTLIMNDDIKIEDIIDLEHHIFVSKYIKNINGKELLHTGNFIIKSSEESKEILLDLYNNPKYYIYNKSDVCEEGAITDYVTYKEKHSSLIKILAPNMLSTWLPIPVIHENNNLDKGETIRFNKNDLVFKSFDYIKPDRKYYFTDVWVRYNRGDFILHVSSPASYLERVSFINTICKRKESFI